jgi:hypothetical protein
MLNYSNHTDLKMLIALVPEGVPRTNGNGATIKWASHRKGNGTLSWAVVSATHDDYRLSFGEYIH